MTSNRLGCIQNSKQLQSSAIFIDLFNVFGGFNDLQVDRILEAAQPEQQRYALDKAEDVLCSTAFTALCMRSFFGGPISWFTVDRNVSVTFFGLKDELILYTFASWLPLVCRMARHNEVVQILWKSKNLV